MPSSCAFCGSTQPLTREHVFGQWVSKIGLDLSPAMHHAGALNGLPRDMGDQPPYRLQVKKFCAPCNNGWMSQLENAAQRVLTPFILGKPGTIAVEDQAVIAMWAQKTALTAMLVSSEKQRDEGYGLAPSEYIALYEQRERMQPLDASQIWVGKYVGDRWFFRRAGDTDGRTCAGEPGTRCTARACSHHRARSARHPGATVHVAGFGSECDDRAADAATMAKRRGAAMAGRTTLH
ncbi:hypothetical protein QF038_001890 [Pseudarthrobacter sp. W1I19]|nr:hypothetical protein [Pseudarthrobacter sp. W1I19]